jgi:antitoxin component YwqK of YwqJK toxin-antitoxin module
MRIKLNLFPFVIATLALFACSTGRISVPTYQKLTLTQGDSVLEFRITDKVITADAEKEYFWFKQQQIHSAIGSYSGHLLDQEFSVFTTSGDLKQRGYFQNGLKTKTWITYKGEVMIRQEFVDGKKEGLYQDLFNGQLRCEGKFKDGLRNGKFTTYNGEERHVEMYMNGDLVVNEESTEEPQFKEKNLREKKEKNEE